MARRRNNQFFYFKDIESRCNIGHDCILYNSFFVANLVEDDDKYNISKVTRFVKPEMFKKKKIIIPINLHNNHWAIGDVDIEMKEIKYFVSKHNDGDLYVKALLQFVHDAWSMFNQDSTLTFNNEWKTIPCDDNIQWQANEYDCGVFCCMYAECIATNSPLNFTQDDVTSKRRKMWYTILQSHHFEKIVFLLQTS